MTERRRQWACTLLLHLPLDRTYEFAGEVRCNNCGKVIGWHR